MVVFVSLIQQSISFYEFLFLSSSLLSSFFIFLYSSTSPHFLPSPTLLCLLCRHMHANAHVQPQAISSFPDVTMSVGVLSLFSPTIQRFLSSSSLCFLSFFCRFFFGCFFFYRVQPFVLIPEVRHPPCLFLVPDHRR